MPKSLEGLEQGRNTSEKFIDLSLGAELRFLHSVSGMTYSGREKSLTVNV